MVRSISVLSSFCLVAIFLLGVALSQETERGERQQPDRQQPDRQQPEPEVKNIPPGAPPLEVMKAQVEKSLWGPPNQGNVKHFYKYETIRFGAPKIENFPVKNNPVFPVIMICNITVRFPDGVERVERKNQTFEFYKDGFGDWTYRFIQNN